MATASKKAMAQRVRQTENRRLVDKGLATDWPSADALRASIKAEGRSVDDYIRDAATNGQTESKRAGDGGEWPEYPSVVLMVFVRLTPSSDWPENLMSKVTEMAAEWVHEQLSIAETDSRAPFQVVGDVQAQPE